MSAVVDTWGGRSLATEINVDEIAAIVQVMIAGGQIALEDDVWLNEHVRKAGLARHECRALEALRVRLRNRVTLQGDAIPTTWYR